VTTEEHQATHDPLRPNVKTFKPSSFQLSQFEVVAQGTQALEFSRQEFPVVQGRDAVVDPMFEVYDELVVTQEYPEEIEPTDEVRGHTEGSVFAFDVARAAGGEESDPSGGFRGAADSLESGVTEDVDQALVSESPLVALTELELLRKSFDEERIALKTAHEQQIEEVQNAIRQEVEAHASRESEERIRAIEERYRTIIDDMGAQIHQEIEAVERRAVEFSLQIARKLVGTIVEINPEYILQVIKEAVKLTGGATIKAIKVNPQDLEFLKMVSPDRQFKEFDGSWSFQADETIRAGCIVETSSGEVEFNLDKAWERIKESVTKVR
jgi:flagellar biosynthesis/type III secretory pathway protein FliH